MSVLDQVMDMRSRGIADKDIIRSLQDQGIMPSEITDALSKAQIKSAVSDMGDGGSNVDSGNFSSQMTAGMQPSILGSEGEPDRLPTEGNINDADLTPPIPSGYAGKPNMPMYMTKEIPGSNQGEQQEMYQPQESYYQPQPQYQYQQPDYAQQGYGYTPAAGMDTDTMIEVAEQVFSEKNRPIQKKVDDMAEFRTLAQANIDYISERLKKIEMIIDKLQVSILEKVGNYGYSVDAIRKEMGMMQDSFSKMIGRAAERQEGRNQQNVTVHRSSKTTRKTTKR